MSDEAQVTGARSGAPSGPQLNSFVQLLQLVQTCGTPPAVDPARDGHTKADVSIALRQGFPLTVSRLEGLMSQETFSRIAGDDVRLESNEILRELDRETPESRKRLFPKVQAHAALLATGFDQISDRHLEAGKELAEWIAENYRPGQPLDVICVCTGNSRRSMFGATMGNIASAYYGLPEVRFYSGGTHPTACNSRTIAALRDIGVEIQATGEEAPRGEPNTANPIYRMRWGKSDGRPTFEMREFSKKYDDSLNPGKGFAALMVCSEADGSCPVVKGAAIRISLPYFDPKVYDDSAFESAKYAERRDDIGRTMLAVMLQARQGLRQASQ